MHRALDEIATLGSRIPDADLSAALCLNALRSLEEYSAPTLAKADKLIERAYEMDPRGSYLAWRGYLRTFRLGEKQGGCPQAISEEMESLILRAVELEPSNSMVLSMAAFMRSVWRVSGSQALEYAEKSNKLNPTNALGISYLGLVHSHIGNHQKGYELARRAQALTSKGMMRSSIGYVAMRTAACAGHFGEAVRIGEELCQAIPGFVAPRRMMGLLYQELGMQEQAEALAEGLQAIDPTYDLRDIRQYYRTAPQMKNSALANRCRGPRARRRLRGDPHAAVGLHPKRALKIGKTSRSRVFQGPVSAGRKTGLGVGVRRWTAAPPAPGPGRRCWRRRCRNGGRDRRCCRSAQNAPPPVTASGARQRRQARPASPDAHR